MIFYLLFAYFAYRACILLYRNELITGMGVNLSDASFDSGSESAEYMITLDSAKGAVESGDGTQRSSSIRGLSGVTMAEQWILTSDFTAGGDITGNLQKRTENFSADFGGAMSESSGIFTFPVTGYYQIIFEAVFRRDEPDGHANSVLNNIKVTTDGSSYSTEASGQTQIMVDASAFSWFANSQTSLLMQVANTSNYKVMFNASLDGAGRLLSSNTSFKFIRLGDL